MYETLIKCQQRNSSSIIYMEIQLCVLTEHGWVSSRDQYQNNSQPEHMHAKFGWIIRNLCSVFMACPVLQSVEIIISHYGDVIMGAIAYQITSLTIVYSTVYSDADQSNIKAPRHLSLCGNSPGTGEFPAQMASNAENVSIWWRHHGVPGLSHVLSAW